MKSIKPKIINDNSGVILKLGKAHALKLIMMSLAKKGTEFNNEELKKFSKNVFNNISSEFIIKNKSLIESTIDQSEPVELDDFKELQPEYIYKYISLKSLSYITRGIFQVGSTGYFQKMQNEKARDILEGIVFISTKTETGIINSSIEMGFNHFIFCATTQDNNELSQYHVDSFGPILLKIKAKPFLEKIAKRIGATSYSIQRVIYSDAKLLKTKLDIRMTLESFSNFSSIESSAYFNHLITKTSTQSLFIKSNVFKPENELRVVFTMPFDVRQNDPKRFEHCGLKKYIEIIS